MNDLKEFDPFVRKEKRPYPVDEATLAAIEAGIRDSNAGRVVTSEEARRLVKQWISELSTRNPR